MMFLMIQYFVMSQKRKISAWMNLLYLLISRVFGIQSIKKKKKFLHWIFINLLLLDIYNNFSLSLSLSLFFLCFLLSQWKCFVSFLFDKEMLLFLLLSHYSHFHIWPKWIYWNENNFSHGRIVTNNSSNNNRNSDSK